MSSSSDSRFFGRREFLRLGALTATTAGVAGTALGQNASPETAAPANGPASRVLGRTGLKVNVIGIGTLQITEPALIQARYLRWKFRSRHLKKNNDSTNWSLINVHLL